MPDNASPRHESIRVCLAAVLALSVWTLFAGKDISWDLLNHHVYLPFAWLSGRHLTDLFPAGPQSYQNPLGYLPGYLLLATDAPAWIVGVALTALQGLPAAWALHRIAVAVWGAGDAERPWRWLAVALAIAAPVFLLLVGTTSVDPLCAALVLVAVAATLQAQPRAWLLVAGGAALGLAVAIKPTSGVFAIGIAPVLVLRLGLRQLTLQQAMLFALASVALAVAGMGAWSWGLWQRFGNPLFPLFNHWFQSPFAPTGQAAALRFLPANAWELLSRLWEMADIRSYATTEAFVPDLRPALAAALALVAVPLSLLRRPLAGTSSAWRRADVQLGMVLLVSYLPWMLSSGNARYAVAWFLLAGVLAARLLHLVLPGSTALLVAPLLLAGQLALYVDAGDHRFKGVAWDARPYIEARIAPQLTQSPFLHLSVGVLSYGAVAPYLHPQGMLINVAGQMTLPADGPLGEALNQRLSQWQGRTRFLLPAPPDGVAQADLEKVRFATWRYGLTVDWSTCLPVTLRLGPWPEGQPRPRGKAGTDLTLDLVSCAAKPTPRHDADIEQRLAQADAVFALIERACPRPFSPAPMVSDVGSSSVQRLYINSDARVTVSPTDGVSITHFRNTRTLWLGTIDQVVANGGRDACEAWKKFNIR